MMTALTAPPSRMNSRPAVDGVDASDYGLHEGLVQAHAIGIAEKLIPVTCGAAPGDDLVDAAWIAPVIKKGQDHLHSTWNQHLQPSLLPDE